MATIALAATGAALGGAAGGSFLGLSGAVLGRAVGATLGRVIDQRLMGAGSQVIEAGKLERYKVTGASEGAAIGRIFGRMRVGGQVIWTTTYREHVKKGGGGKGGGSGAKTKQYTYSVSLAVAVCEGEISRVGRVWADGIELHRDQVNMRFYSGSEDQLPDALIEAVEGVGNAPAYRGTAYVVFEDLPLADYGNRVPQFSFEVIRSTDPDVVPENSRGAAHLVEAVAMMPGTGEYALATTPVRYTDGWGTSKVLNVNAPGGQTDFSTSLQHLTEELPNCGSVSLIVSWFGDDLRAGHCSLKPKVEQNVEDGSPMPWTVSGLTRSTAEVIVQEDNRPVYGGTPTDKSVIEAIAALNDKGQKVVFYPFILMEQMPGNLLPDPWSGEPGQAHLPWRGRITTSLAPGMPGSPDGTAQAELEVASFFGAAAPGDFLQQAEGIGYSGPAEWSFRRMILHYAHLCAMAGGVDSFCIGSEMRALTQIRGAGNSFPAVSQLKQLVADVRSILGPATKIGYCADWSEYFGYHPQDGSGDVFFHLDALWADPDIDFIGIDNYMPLSDWRDGSDHADSAWRSIYNLEYLKANIAGGEGYDWYYADDAGRDAQNRVPIEDGAYGEPWVFRYKDLRNWWTNLHHNRIGGIRQSVATEWEPQSKPIWFTELGCAAMDKATNQPNKFLDPKSSESKLAYYSNGVRDDLIQSQYLRAMAQYWSDPANNPTSPTYGGPMVDPSRAHVWAWDARPFPQFPGLIEKWADGENYARGHWLNGRITNETLAGVVTEICARSGVEAVDVSDLHGLVRGYQIDQVGGGRGALQPLMLAYGFDAAEREGVLHFKLRSGDAAVEIDLADLAVTSELDGDLQQQRTPEAETAGRVRLAYVTAEGDFDTGVAEAVFPDEDSRTVSSTEVPIALTRGEARRIAERWLSESRVARDTAKLALPKSRLDVAAGDIISLKDGPDRIGKFRIDHVDQGIAQLIEAVRVEEGMYRPGQMIEERVLPRPFTAASAVLPVFLDLPLLTGDEIPHAPHLAVTSDPWPGTVALYKSASDSGYELDTYLEQPAVIGRTEAPLSAAATGHWDRGPALRVRVIGGDLSSAEVETILTGANAMAIGNETESNWEIFQFSEAELVGPNTYDLRMRLRGQLGTDSFIPEEWPSGSTVVLLDGALRQIGLAQSSRGGERHYRIGPSHLGYEDHTFVHSVQAFEGNGLRPYAPVHLRARRSGGDLNLSWIRRTRMDGDNWGLEDVPLGEERERYAIRVVIDNAIVRQLETVQPFWTYGASIQSADSLPTKYAIEVAQISERFGAGPFRRIEING